MFKQYNTKMNKFISPYVYISSFCNNNCIFCSEAGHNTENSKLRPLGDIKKDICKIKKSYDFINFMGREPTLRDDLIIILKFAKQAGFKQVGLTSNGRLFYYKDFIRSVLKTGIDQIGISLCGPTAEIHDRQTMSPGSFYQTMEGIKNINKFKNPKQNILVNLPLNKLNFMHLGRTLGLLKKLKIKEIGLLYVSPLSKRSCDPKIIMNMSELGRHTFNILKKRRLLETGNSRILLVEFLPCSLPKEARKYFFPCLEKNQKKVRLPLCMKCIYKDRCDGIHKDYLKIFGSGEFIPFENNN